MGVETRAEPEPSEAGFSSLRSCDHRPTQAYSMYVEEAAPRRPGVGRGSAARLVRSF
jgi:hypothetical protein